MDQLEGDLAVCHNDVFMVSIWHIASDANSFPYSPVFSSVSCPCSLTACSMFAEGMHPAAVTDVPVLLPSVYVTELGYANKRADAAWYSGAGSSTGVCKGAAGGSAAPKRQSQKFLRIIFFLYFFSF